MTWRFKELGPRVQSTLVMRFEDATLKIPCEKVKDTHGVYLAMKQHEPREKSAAKATKRIFLVINYWNADPNYAAGSNNVPELYCS